ncbi:DUF2336 domain-containing protein [Rickettsiales bacterium]|nr:DUF2336 domain-containing protein [Rickettsiales bacterium]
MSGDDKTGGKSLNLTASDIEKLIKSDDEKKLEVTQKISDYYSSGGFKAEDMQFVTQIFRSLVKDTKIEIRKALSDAIKDMDDVSEDVVRVLAADVGEVSIPILQFSEVLTDEDLIEIITSSNDSEKQVAISKRSNVAEGVSNALIETSNEDVVDSLLKNESAAVSSEGYDKIVEKFAEKEEIMESVITRDSLPISIVERLTSTISDAIYNKLADKHRDVFDKVGSVVKRGQDVTVMKMIGMKTTERDYAHFRMIMDKMKIAEDLAPIYALCMGNLAIFEACIARKTQTPIINIRTLVFDETNRGIKALYKKTGLPENLFVATVILVGILRKNPQELKVGGIYLTKNQADFLCRELVDRADKYPGKVESLDYIMSLIQYNVKEDGANQSG